ncbi:MAG: hypothetical protein Q8N02_11080 [Methylotenera sp.]|nr:hypothetical protein [Methylotenera sp.]MDO9233334.1 hypothetical protein [Methylotenera sp.]MDO9389765.1 hypothetical protein [Methylotenera sp.]MDP2403061.1 hypothetical protein [Methylotenera sp.]MDP3096104.1 hypothetical protein [Methylotenera sp.]
MKGSTLLVSTLLVVPTVLYSGLVMAQDPLPDLPGYVTQSVIDSNVLSHVRGRFAVNMTAGDSNVQANATAVALGAEGGSAIGLVGGIQVTDPRQGNLPDLATASIGSNVFANSSGLISVNQSSGVGNAQANGAAFAMGFEEVVAESVLSAATSNAVPTGAGAGKSHQAVSINDTAFDGAHGLVQVNQSAGSGNSTANNFALQVQLGAKP